jgi:hypothetical protein
VNTKSLKLGAGAYRDQERVGPVAVLGTIHLQLVEPKIDFRAVVERHRNRSNADLVTWVELANPSLARPNLDRNNAG